MLNPFDGQKLFYLGDGVPGSCSESGSNAQSHGFHAKLAIASPLEAAQKFDDAARHVGQGF